MKTLSCALSALALGVGLSTPAAAQCPGTDDAFEDNDDCASPWMLAAGSYPGLYTEKEALDHDYFEFTIPTDEVLTVTADFLHANGDVDMRLWDPGCFATLDTSASTTDQETLVWTNATGAPETVVIEVYVWSNSGFDCNTYDLTISTAPNPCLGTDDALEDNDDCATAIPAPLGATAALFVSKFDFDYYSYTLADQETFDASAFFLHVNGDIDLILYDVSACGGGIGSGIAQSVSVTDDEFLSYTNTSGGPQDVVLEVNVWAGSANECNVYDLDIQPGGGVGGPIGTNYCGPANLNSTGGSAAISAFGFDIVAKNDVVLTASQMPPNQFGYFLTSPTQGFIPLPGGSQGNLCLSGDIGRFNQSILDSGPAGEFSLAIDLTNIPIPTGFGMVDPGETWNFTCWFRDVNPTPTSNFTDGIEIVFQ